jgi:hypothetical protein
MVDPLRRVEWLLVLSLLTACSSTPLRGRPDLLDFLSDGSTTRDQVIERLGQPYRRLQDDRLYTYRLSHDDAGSFVSYGMGEASWTGLDASLVLAFDEKGALRRHSIVNARKP